MLLHFRFIGEKLNFKKDLPGSGPLGGQTRKGNQSSLVLIRNITAQLPDSVELPR